MQYKRYPDRLWRHLLSGPFIYMMIIPLVVVDVFVFFYQHICFRLYGIPLVERKKYIRIDRHKLSYLSGWEKINCMYCGYANGLMHYASVIAGETEKYWCSIKHKAGNEFIPPAHHRDFLEYGDQASYEALEPSHKHIEADDSNYAKGS